MIAFYRTPTGQKALKVLPQVTAEFLGTMLPRIQILQARAADSFDAVLRRRGYLK